MAAGVSLGETEVEELHDSLDRVDRFNLVINFAQFTVEHLDWEILERALETIEREERFLHPEDDPARQVPTAEADEELVLPMR